MNAVVALGMHVHMYCGQLVVDKRPRRVRQRFSAAQKKEDANQRHLHSCTGGPAGLRPGRLLFKQFPHIRYRRACKLEVEQ